MPLQDTLAVQRILNEACEKLGVFHTEDSYGRRLIRLCYRLRPIDRRCPELRRSGSGTDEV